MGNIACFVLILLTMLSFASAYKHRNDYSLEAIKFKIDALIYDSYNMKEIKSLKIDSFVSKITIDNHDRLVRDVDGTYHLNEFSSRHKEYKFLCVRNYGKYVYAGR